MILINLKKRLRSFTLEIDIKFGCEFAILTGPNGSGKSTVLRAVAGIEKMESGRIIVSGRTFLDENICLKPENRKVGYLCQETSLFPWLTVRENVSFGLSKDGREKEKAWLELLHRELGIEHILDQHPANLSGGEAQRAAIARALAIRPGMLLLDEPFTGIDSDARKHLLGFLKDVRRKMDIPALMVTHDHAEAHILGDRVFEVSDGKIKTSGERGRLAKIPYISY